jgi:hypothetical protein
MVFPAPSRGEIHEQKFNLGPCRANSMNRSVCANLGGAVPERGSGVDNQSTNETITTSRVVGPLPGEIRRENAASRV